jgi:S1-C subfamily serine protease
MEEEKRTIYTVVALVVVVGLVLSCVAGALAGGLSGFVVGRRQANRALENAVVERSDYSEEQQFSVPEQDEDELPFGLPPDMVPGALIVDVIAGSPAEDAGLQVGDVIVAVDQTPIDQHHQLADVIHQYEPGDIVTLNISRAGGSESMRVKLGGKSEDPNRAYLGIYYEMIMDIPEWEAPRG